MRKYTLLTIFFCLSVNIFAQLIPEYYGDAVSLGDNCYRITENTTQQSGSVWYNNVIDLNTDFEIIFDANFGSNDANGADGMAFVMKTTATAEIGLSGGGVGYEGITQSLIVEFDTWTNGNRADITADHMALMKNGSTYHNSANNLAGPIQASETSINIEDGNYHEVKVAWDATAQNFTVTFDCSERIAYSADIINTIFNGTSEVYFGFAGSTGAAYNLQQLCFKHISFSSIGSLSDKQVCAGGSIDTIDATYDGAEGYEWSPAESVSDPSLPNPVFSPTEDTTYTVSITDNCGDILTKSFNVVVMPESTAEVEAVNPTVCPGDDGEFIITGVPNSTVTYIINEGVEETVVLDDTGVASVVVMASTENTTMTLVGIDAPNPTISGNGQTAYGGINPENAEGPIEPEGTTATSANSARVSNTYQSCVLLLDQTVPAGTEITLSVAKNNSTAQMSVSDGTNSQTINTGTVNVLQYVTFITGQDTNMLTFISLNGYFWIDGIEYTIELPNCYTALDDSETISFSDLDDATFVMEPTCDGATATAATPGGTYVIVSPAGPGIIDPLTGTITGGLPGEEYTIEYTTNENCGSTSSGTVTILPEPEVAEANPSLQVCDDNIPDGLTAIDLALVNNNISGGTPGYVVSYYLTQADAESDINPLSIPYTNITNPQTIYARLLNSTTGCYTTTTVVLSVEQAPEANIPDALEYCDADSDGFGVFDLSDADAAITGGATGLVLSYHETFADADNGVNALSSPYNNIVANDQILYVRVESATIATDCATIVELALVVHPTPQ
ncbi:L-type lectin-domain containing protein, partial [Mangrovimonas sp. TPBH4]|uniref:L-type lectin-domain containing protein n=1 Tax=Mangrovimonas sp. TPBH4 TaxID=1645914 RepID=UPI000B3137FC